MPASELIYHSQIGQDRYFIERIAKERTGGRFLDIGCHDGLTFSNTLTLERDLGWSGILVEADPDLAIQAKNNRPRSRVINAAVWSQTARLTLATPASGDKLLTRVDGMPHNAGYFEEEFRTAISVEVEARPVREILPGDMWFDYVSIDIEGAELEALFGIDHDRMRFGFLCVEHGERYGYLSALVDYLQTAGYWLHRINLHDAEFLPF